MDPALMPHNGRFLNIGCGRRVHPSWVNIDVQPTDPRVMAHDIKHGLPFPDETFEVVYHSHLLEHLPPAEGLRLLHECHRVLKAGGTVRVAVPDLEEIARLYLKSLDLARQGDPEWEDNYDWMMIELYDQSVRETSGGGHGAYLNRDVIPNVDFVLTRQGKEVEESISGQRRLRAAAAQQAAHNGRIGFRRFIPAGLGSRLGRLKKALSANRSAHRRESKLRRALGPEYELLELGRFRRSGEVHQWMYDSYSLSRALVQVGFVSPRRMCANESRVADWASFYLDTEPDGRVYKPDSLYVEAVKGERAMEDPR